jgi:hypothetical protein
MAEQGAGRATHLLTHRFTTQGNLQPSMQRSPGMERARLFEIEGETLAWLACYESQKHVDVPDSLGWTENALNIEGMAFKLQRDVSNGGHTQDETRWLYVVHTDVPDDVACEYTDWYDQEHLPRLVGVPGVVRARRYVACDAHPRYFTAYDLADRDAFTSPQGLEARKTPWTEKMRNLFSNTRRFTARLIVDEDWRSP